MNFKNELVESRFEFMCEEAKALAKEMSFWLLKKYNVEMVITETFTTEQEDQLLKRQSDTHRTGRAFDIRTGSIPNDILAEFIAVFRKKYSSIGAFANGQRNLIVYKPHGTGPHLHVQLDRKFSIKKRVKNEAV